MKIADLQTVSLLSGTEKYSGYVDKDYFVIRDNEYSRLGEPAAVTGKILVAKERNTTVELITTPTAMSLASLIFILVCIVVIAVLAGLSIIPLFWPSVETIVSVAIAFSATLLAIRSQYYSVKRTVVSALLLKPQN